MDKDKQDPEVEMVVRLIVENTHHTFKFSTETTESFIAASKEAIDLIKDNPDELKRFADKVYFALTDFIRVGILKKQIQEYRNRVVDE